MKLIDGEKLAEMLRSETVPMTEYGKGIHDGFAFAIAQIETMQEAGRHARWVLSEANSDGFCYSCTGCGQEIQTTYEYDVVCEYCPECGAKMDGR